MSTRTETKEEKGQRICWKCGATYAAEQEVCAADGARLLILDQGDLEDPLIGSLFDGRFRIYKKLGEGGMGNVYSARQIDFERDVALKILKADFLRDENIRKRFMYEARAISNLRHPNALRLFDFGQAPDGSFYMVMELLEGESLADRLAYKFVSFRDVFNIVPPVAGVLFEAHQNKVIHRDLKPENIYLVDVNGRHEFTKLLDFGIAKHLQDRTMTRSGTLWGTPAYMSPEQAKGDTVGAHADIYAIGIILFELISGNLPFHSETQMGLAMKHININARPLRSIPGLYDVVPEALDDIVMECLAKDPTDRPANAQIVAQRLEDIRRDFFDDALLDTVPAEEVDAIALQDWLAAEPDVSDEAPIPPLVRESQTIETQPPSAAEMEHARNTLRGSGELTADVSDEEFRAVRPSRRIGLVLAVGAVLAVAAIVFASVFSGTEEVLEAEERPVMTAAVQGEQAAGTAGAAAANAAAVVMQARNLSEALDAADTLAAEIAAEPARAPSQPKKEDLDEVKNEIERTF